MRILVVCRFIPGGRTAVTLSCGLIGYPRRRFVAATAVAAVVWALYAFFNTAAWAARPSRTSPGPGC